MISFQDFLKIDIRIGTIVHAEPFTEARTPAYKLTIDFGDMGIKTTSAQITKRYTCAELVGKQIAAVVNFPPKQIANFMSECLVLGAVDDDDVALLEVKEATNGKRVG
jgi:tRNA-binding protein